MEFKYLLTSAALLGLTACGGGGSGGGESSGSGGGGTPPNTLAPLTITEENSEEVSASVSQTTLDEDGFFDSDFVTGGVTTTASSDTLNMRSILNSAYQQLRNAPNLVTGVTIPRTTEQCEVSGTLTVSGEISSDLNLSVGDFISSEFDNCNDGEQVLDGRLDFTVTASSGDLLFDTDFSLGFNIKFDSYTISDNNETAFIDGDASSLVVVNGSNERSEMRSTWLALTIDGRVQSIANYELISTYDSVTQAYTIDTSGTLHDQNLGGSFTYETIDIFTGTGNSEPSSGTMEITGADGSAITLTALNTTDVRLEIDTDGNGTIDTTITTNWDALETELGN